MESNEGCETVLGTEIESVELGLGGETVWDLVGFRFRIRYSQLLE